MGMRIDRAMARNIAYYLSSLSRKQINMSDFSPYDKAVEDAKEGTIEDAFDMFRALAKHG